MSASTKEAQKEIWKYPLGNGMEQTMQMPSGAKILTVQVQHGHACLWAMVEPENDMEDRRIFVVGTGHPVPSGEPTYIGTIQQGLFVWHIFHANSNGK